MIVYPLAVGIACWMSLRIALSRLPEGLPLWGALVFALNVGTVAVTFNFPLFISQGGMEFWLLNSSVFAAATIAAQRKAPRRPTPATGPLKRVPGKLSVAVG
jgi:hypothetical protein